MKYLVVNEVNGEIRNTVHESDNTIGAMYASKFAIEKEANYTNENDECATIGIYEVGGVNHLDAIVENNLTHSYYNKRLKEKESAE